MITSLGARASDLIVSMRAPIGIASMASPAFHLYLDDIFPKTYGQPLIGATGAEPRMLTF